MRINFKNFGHAASGAIALNDLTLICGPNSSGKTYTSYAVYAVLKHFSDFFDFGLEDEVLPTLLRGEPAKIDLNKIREEFDEHLDRAGRNFASGLERFFNAPDDFFDGSEFSFELSEQDIQPLENYSFSINVAKKAKIEGEVDPDLGILTLAYSQEPDLNLPRTLIRRIISQAIFDAFLDEVVPTPFVVTSERTGVSLFYKDLDYHSNAVFSHLRDSDKIDPIRIIEAMRSRYAMPIQDNIDTVRDYENISRRKSFLKESKEEYKFVFDALNELVGGGSYRSYSGQLTFSPRKKRRQPKLVIPLYIASSSLKSLFLVDVYINHVARKNQILIIDEPELNLHPDNQVLFARLIARLVNAGVKVLVTTHSDYIIREINNLVSLSGEISEKENLLKKYKLSEYDLLKPQQVSAYSTGADGEFSEMSVKPSGIDTTIFDNIISNENAKAQDIYFSMDEVDEG